MTTAVLWDLDGVLIDSEPLLFEAERIAFASHGVALTPEMKQPFIGLGGREVLEQMVRAFGVDADVAALADLKMGAYLELLAQVQAYPQTTRLARMLREFGVPMAVASGSTPEMINQALTSIGLTGVIDTRVSVTEVPHGKPAPDVFLEAARRLGVEPRDCVVIEDAAPGVRAAKAAGMSCIAIPYVTEPLDVAFSHADLVVRGGQSAVRAEELFAWVIGHEPDASLTAL